jgi:serine/threonine protein kinase
MRSRRGGLLSKEDQNELLEDQVDRILEDDETIFEFVQRGTFGFVFKVTYKAKIKDSGFIDFETGKQQRIFIMKVQAMDFEMSLKHPPEGDNTELPPDAKRIEWDRLIEEVDLQKKLFERALKENFRPPCPAILDVRRISLQKLDSYVQKNKKQSDLIYKDYHELILPHEYDGYNAGIILMEFVPALDIITLSNINPDIYVKRYDEIRSKVFRAYCTALKCGIDQVDVKENNYLFGEDGTITMIDFGIAKELVYTGMKSRMDPKMLYEYIEKAEKTEHYTELKKYLLKYNDRLTWLFNPKYGKTVFEPLLPIPLNPEVAEHCTAGLCKFEYPTERTRTRQQIDTRMRRIKDEKDLSARIAVEAKEEALKREHEREIRETEMKEREEEMKSLNPLKMWKSWNRPFSEDPFHYGRYGGTKRYIKYEMGNRRHKKIRTRRKIHDHSFRKL